LQDVNNTGPETLPVSVCNCFLYLFYELLCSVKKLKQEVLLDQRC